MGTSLFRKIRTIGRDLRKEQVMRPASSDPEIELTDEELESLRGGHGHRYHYRRHYYRYGGYDCYDYYYECD